MERVEDGPDPEASLVARAREGSKEAFCELVRLNQGAVHAFLARYIRSRDLVEDLAQETFLKAYRSLPAFQAASSLRAWFLGIARNEALMHLRAEERRRSHSLEAAVSGWLGERVGTAGAGPGEADEKRAALESCIKRLPERSAAMLADFYFRGLSPEEIARRAGRPKGTVAVALFRIREALRKCVRLEAAAAGGAP